ncbi:MAG: HNH endonuclease signature motif containing protein [Gemmataceae bacterium]
MSAFSPARRAEVTARAGGRCEYCHLPTRGQVATFPIDHIIPRSAGGANELGNLALTCPRCNAYKWEAVNAADPLTGEQARLFNPRQDAWDDHFAWTAGQLAGRTAVGRATVACLRINDPDFVEVRMLLAELGLFPEAGG